MSRCRSPIIGGLVAFYLMLLPWQGHGAQRFARPNTLATQSADQQVATLFKKLSHDLSGDLTHTRCLTPLLLEAERNSQRLGSDSLLELRALQAGKESSLQGARWEFGRPYSAGSFQSDHYPLTVHYRLRNQTEIARQVLSIAEYSWDRLLEMGFYVPIPDEGQGGSSNLDIYLSTDLRTGGGAYTATTNDDSNPADDLQSCASYIAVFEGLDMATEMPVFVAHELAHAFQAAMDFQEGTFFWESSAVAFEDLAYPNINDYYSFVDNFQDVPHYGLNESGGIYPYGAVVFAQFLDEVLGEGNGQALGTIWQRTAQGSDINEPDYLDTIENISQEVGLGPMAQVISLFSGWRYFVAEWDDGYHLPEASAWPSKARVDITAELLPSDLPAFALAPDPNSYTDPQDMGTNYYSFDTQDYASESIALELRGDPSTQWSITAIHWYADKKGVITPLGLTDGDGSLTAELQVVEADRLIFAVSNVGRTDFDADEDAQASTYELDILGL